MANSEAPLTDQIIGAIIRQDPDKARGMAAPYTDDQLRQIWNGWDDDERNSFFWFMAGRAKQGTFDAVRYVQSQDRIPLVPPVKPLKGKTSDRIRSGEIPGEAISNKRIPADDRPDPKNVQTGSGRALGKPGRSWPGDDEED